MPQISLGLITCVTPGQPIRATVNQSDPTVPLYVHAYTVQRVPGNTGATYVGLKSTDDRVAKTQMLGVLGTTSETSFSSGNPMQPNGINIGEVYLDFDQGGDKAIISAIVS